MEPVRSATSEVLPRSKVMMSQEKVESLGVHHRLRSAAVAAHHCKINEPSIRTIAKKEKEICEAIAAAMPTGTEILHFLRNLFLSC